MCFLLALLWCAKGQSITFKERLEKELNPDNRFKLFVDTIQYSINYDLYTAFDYLQEASLLEKELHDSSLLKLYNLWGQAYFYHGDYSQSADFFFKELDVQARYKPTAVPFVYINIGNVYFKFGEHTKARSFYEQAIDKLDHPIDSVHYIVLNNLAAVERRDSNYTKSLNLLNDYKALAHLYQDTFALITSHVNMANIFSDMENYEKVTFHRDSAIYLSKKAGDRQSLTLSYLNRGISAIEKYRALDTAKHYLLQAYELSDSLGLKMLKEETLKWLTKTYEQENNFEQANHYLKLHNELLKSSSDKGNLEELDFKEKHYQFKLNQQELLYENTKQRLLYFWIALSSLLGLVVLFLFFRVQKNQAKQKSLENKLLAKEIGLKNKELTQGVMKMLQHDKALEDVRAKIVNIKEKSKNTAIKQELTALVNQLYQEEKGLIWKEFDTLFLETNQDFYKNLLKDFPTLTQNELRLCAFLKLNLKTKEISAITYQSVNSITVARSRLRKKIGIDSSKESLPQFLANY